MHLGTVPSVPNYSGSEVGPMRRSTDKSDTPLVASGHYLKRYAAWRTGYSIHRAACFLAMARESAGASMGWLDIFSIFWPSRPIHLFTPQGAFSSTGAIPLPKMYTFGAYLGCVLVSIPTSLVSFRTKSSLITLSAVLGGLVSMGTLYRFTGCRWATTRWQRNECWSPAFRRRVVWCHRSGCLVVYVLPHVRHNYSVKWTAAVRLR